MDQLDRERFFAIGFCVFAIAALIGSLAIFDGRLQRKYLTSDIKKCRQSVEWCEIEHPQLHEAMYGDQS